MDNNNQPQHKIPRWLKITLVLWLVLFGTQIPSCMMSYSAKVGRVVDQTTGQGMPDVPVIAVGKFFAMGFHGSKHDCRYRVITATDANGYYSIPNQWRHMTGSPLGGDTHTYWTVTAFKPGYAVSGDEPSWSEFDQYGEPKHYPSSIIEPPFSWPFGFWVWVNPIEMKPVQLGLKEEAVYYKEVIETRCNTQADKSLERALRKQAYDILLPKVCSLDPDREIDSTETYALRALVLDQEKTAQRIKKLEPENWTKERRKYQAAHICEAMRAGGESP